MTAKKSVWSPLWETEDYWAIWLGLGVIVFAQVMYATGHAGGLAGFAVAPPSDWTSLGPIMQHLAANWLRYAVLFLAFLGIFTSSVRIMGHDVRRYVPGFVVIYLASVVILLLSSSRIAHYYNLEAPLLALIVGLIAGNLWSRAEVARDGIEDRVLHQDRHRAAGGGPAADVDRLGGPNRVSSGHDRVGVHVADHLRRRPRGCSRRNPSSARSLVRPAPCAASAAAIAVGASVKAKKEQIAIAISVVTIWAIVMIFFIPLASRALRLPTAVAGAWVGTSEFADAAGLAAAQAYAPPMPEPLAEAVRAEAAGTATAEQRTLVERERPLDENENSVRAFTLMKVIGRDIWIGIWCFILSIVAVTVWERRAGGGSGARVSAGVIWERFPKFVLGFVAASILMTVTVKAYGAESGDAFSAIRRDLINPIKTLRTWTFVFTFLCIGLTTRFRELTRFGWQPFWAFTIGVAVNVPLGFFLSSVVFRNFWLQIR